MHVKGAFVLRLQIRAYESAETYEQLQQRMIEETGRFIQWGLAHPELVPRIPTHPVGRGRFSEQLRWWFWEFVLTQEFGPPGL